MWNQILGYSKKNLPLILGDFSDISASPTCLFTPVFVPPVKIQAPIGKKSLYWTGNNKTIFLKKSTLIQKNQPVLFFKDMFISHP